MVVGLGLGSNRNRITSPMMYSWVWEGKKKWGAENTGANKIKKGYHTQSSNTHKCTNNTQAFSPHRSNVLLVPMYNHQETLWPSSVTHHRVQNDPVKFKHRTNIQLQHKFRFLSSTYKYNTASSAYSFTRLEDDHFLLIQPAKKKEWYPVKFSKWSYCFIYL